jgi:hypothetical protein
MFVDLAWRRGMVHEQVNFDTITISYVTHTLTSKQLHSEFYERFYDARPKLKRGLRPGLRGRQEMRL